MSLGQIADKVLPCVHHNCSCLLFFIAKTTDRVKTSFLFKTSAPLLRHRGENDNSKSRRQHVIETRDPGKKKLKNDLKKCTRRWMKVPTTPNRGVGGIIEGSI